MTFRKYDAGVVERPKGVKGDCQVRALATARSISYGEAWELLYAIQGERRMCFLPLVEALRDNDPRLGAEKQVNFPAIRGKARMTGRDFCRKYRTGHYIVRMAHHVAAVKDGVLLDTHDTSRSCVYTAWEIVPKARES